MLEKVWLYTTASLNSQIWLRSTKSKSNLTTTNTISFFSFLFFELWMFSNSNIYPSLAKSSTMYEFYYKSECCPECTDVTKHIQTSKTRQCASRQVRRLCEFYLQNVLSNSIARLAFIIKNSQRYKRFLPLHSNYKGHLAHSHVLNWRLAVFYANGAAHK